MEDVYADLLLNRCFDSLRSFHAILRHKGISPPMNPGVQEQMELATKKLIDDIERFCFGTCEGRQILGNGELECANCGELSTNPGQFAPDGRWVCTSACLTELYVSLDGNGGIPQDEDNPSEHVKSS